MATPKKKHLIELMIEACVKWPDGAEYAAQDKYDLNVNFYKNGKPNFQSCYLQWLANDCTFMSDDGVELDSLCRNWNKTIVTREQYAEALSATAMTPAAQQETQQAPQYCASVMRQMPDNTIEQLTADYHAKAAEADRLQAVADDALKAADDALLALEKAGELIGLVISIDTKQKQVDQQCSSTEWKVGDTCIVTVSPDDSEWVGRECVLIRVDGGDTSLPYKVIDTELREDYWVAGIRRP